MGRREETVEHHLDDLHDSRDRPDIGEEAEKSQVLLGKGR